MKRITLWLMLITALAALTACGGARGTDVCGGYPEPVASPFVGEPGTIVEIHPEDHVRGEADALVTMLVYNDFDCADCAALSNAMTSLVDAHDDVRFVYRHYVFEGNGLLAAIAAEAAADLGGEEAFWEMHDLIMVGRPEWTGLTTEAFTAWLGEKAGTIGLDEDAFIGALGNSAYRDLVDDQSLEAKTAGVSKAPVIAVNELPVSSPPTTVTALNILREAFVPQRMYSEAPPMVIDPSKQYRAWIETSQGTIVIDLFADIAPQTVNNFTYLACNGYYNGVMWHRVIEDFVAQTGDPSGSGLGGPGYTIPDEFDTQAYIEAGMSFNRAGLVAMAKASAPDTARSQFFITLAATPHLDSGFTIFGEVAEGLEVLDELLRYEARGLTPPGEGIEPDTVISITVREVED